MSRNAILAVLGTVLLSLTLPAAAGGNGSRQPVLLLTGVPQLQQCRGILTEAILDSVIAAKEDPGLTFEKARRARPNMAEVPPWIECESKLWKALSRDTGLFKVVRQSSGPLSLQSPDPAAEELIRAQAAGVGANVDPGGGVGDYQGEMQIAVNLNNPQQLVAAANTFFQDTTPNCLSPTGGFSGTYGTQALYGSTDGGATWKYNCAPWPASLTGPAGGNFFFGSDPAVAWDSQGRAYAAYMLLAGANSTAIVVARSTDAGQTWSSLGTVVNDLANPSLFDDKEMIAVDNSAGPPSAKSHPGRLYVIWDQNNIERVAHSDDGVWWTQVVLPSTGFGTYDVGADVKVAGDGTVYVIWNRLIYPGGGQTGEKIVFSKSIDGGTTWSAPVVVVSAALLSFGNNNNPPAQDYRGVNAFGSLDVDRNPASPFFGTLYVAYCDFPAGTNSGTDLNSYVVRSTNGGATWSLPVKTNDDTGTASQFFPWLSVDQSDGTVNVSWYDTRLDPNNRKTQIFYGRSSNGAVSFEPNLLVTDSGAIGWHNAVNYSDENSNNDNFSSNANQYGDYGGCVAANRQVHPFWTDSRQFFPSADNVAPSRLEDAGTATIVNCSAPTGITAPVLSNTCAPSPRIHLSWAAPGGWGTNGTGGTYAVYRSTTATFPGGTALASNLTATTFDDTTGLAGATYYYFVAATNNCPGTILTPMTAVSAASAPAAFPPCGASLGTLSGHVTVNAIPIAGANVGAGLYAAVTDGTGAYGITLVTGTYTVTAAAAGYDTASQSNVVVSNGVTTTQDFALSPTTTAACFTDTTQADFQAGTGMTNVDLTSNPGSVKLATSAPSVYRTSGSLVSSLKDSGAVVPGAGMTWKTLTWAATTPAGTSVTFQIAASNAASGPFTFVGPDGTSATFFTTSGASLAQFNGRRYLKYTAYLATTDSSVTPSLDSVTLCDQISVCDAVTPPVITPSATQVCPFSTGNTATASAGAIAYAWSIVNGTITAGASAPTVTFTAGPSGTTTLILVTSTASGCNAGSTADIATQTSTPTPSITAGGPTTFCNGGSVLLTSSSPSGNQWYVDGTVILGSVGPTYSATAAGNYTVTVTTAGCSSFPSAPVAVALQTPAPTPSIAVSGATTFCAGNSVTLTSTAASGNQWYLNGSPINGATSTTYSTAASGSYTVTATPAGGCTSSPSNPVSVTVKTLPATPTITAGGPTTFCGGGSVTLTSSSATGNSWYNNGLSLGLTTPSISVGASGTYTAIVTANGCVSSASAGVVVTVNPNPLQTPTVSADGPLSFCTGGSVTLTSSYATGNQWYVDGTPIAGATASSLVATTSGKYEVVVTQSGCSVTSAGTSVAVSAQPPTPTISANGPTTFCQGGSVILTSSSGSSSQWYLNGSPLPGGLSRVLSISSSGVYTVVTLNGGCPSGPSAPVTVAVNAIPDRPGMNFSGSLTFCQGGSVTLTSTTALGNQWFKDGQALSGATSQSYPATAAGSYTVVVTQNGCSSTPSAAAPVIVNPIPATPAITPAGSLAICDNAAVTLQSSSATGNQWFLEGSPISGGTQNTYPASTPGNYTLQVTANGCPSGISAPVTVTSVPKPATPSITTTDSLTFCTGGSATLKSSSATGNQWYRDGQLIASATGASYAATASGTYTVVTTAGGCSSSASAGIQVTVNPYPAQPSVTPGGSVTWCSADPPLQLTSSNPAGNQWYLNGGLIANATGQVYNVAQAGVYTVGTTVAGCASSISAPVTVSFATSPAAPAISINGPASFCSVTPTTLTSSSTSGNQWLRNGTPIASATGQSYVPTSSGFYAVQLTNGTCTVTSLGVNITVAQSPSQPSIATSGPTSFCGSVSGVTLTSSNGSGNQWFRDGSAVNGASGVTYQPATAGTYTVQTAGNGCLSLVSSPVVITSAGLAGVTPQVTAPNGLFGCVNVSLSSNYQSGNQWFLNGAPISGATGNTYSATATGNYSVQVSSGSCSSLMSSTLPVQIASAPAKPVVTATGSQTICTPGSITLHSTLGPVDWYRDGTSLFWSADSYVATVPGSYQTRYVSNTSCGQVIVSSDPIVIGAAPTPTVTITTATSVVTGTAGTASVAPMAGATYLWTITGGTFTGSATGTNVSFTAGSIGTMSLKATITGSGGCAASKTALVPVTPIPGQEKFDPNGDVTVDPADIFYLVNYLFTNGPAPKGTGGPVASGDANGDGVVDPADIFYVVSYLFNSGPHPYGHLAGASVAPATGVPKARPALKGSVSLGTPQLHDGRYVVPVLVSTGSGTAQAVSVKVRIAGLADGAAGVTIHRAAALASLTPAFETTRESANAVSYIGSFGENAHLDGVVAEIELDAPPAGTLRLTLDSAVTTLGNATGTLEATVGNGTLTLHGTTISITRPARAKDRDSE